MLSAVQGVLSGAVVLFVIAWLFGLAPIETYNLNHAPVAVAVVGAILAVAWAVEKMGD